MGTIADYLEVQEFGGTKLKRGSVGVAIPTSYAAGQALGSQPRIRLARRANQLKAIRLKRSRKRGSNRKQRNIAAIRSGQKFVFLDLGRRQGIFRVLGGKRKPRIKMVWDMTQQAVVIPRNPWLQPATRRVEKVLPRLYREALRFQLRRHRLFV